MSGLRTAPAGLPRLGRDVKQERQLERFVAYAATFLLALRLNYDSIPLGYAVALAALPVTLGTAARYRGARLIFGLAAVATLSGYLLTHLIAEPGAHTSTNTAALSGLRILMIGAGVLLLLWARSVVGSRALILTYAVGSFAALGVVGINPANEWKFSFAVPVTLLLLSLPLVYRRASVEMGVLVALGLLSAVQDSRSAAAELLIAGALVITGNRRESTRGNTLVVLVRLALFVAGGYLVVQAALLHGDLGEQARARTIEQVQTSGSVLLGGRPELGATWALLSDQPWGYGIGVQATPTQIDTAKAGMAKVGYDPNNGYVDNYMFGNGFEVHSLAGDLWLLAGIAGLALAVATLVCVVWGMANQLSRGVASGAMIFLSVRLIWDFGFAPIASAMLTLMLCVALALPERTEPEPSEAQQA
jgi:hypothetical protein